MKLKSIFDSTKQFALDLIYPRHCALCSKTIGGYADIPLCRSCMDKDFVPKVVRDDRFMFDEAVSAVKYEEAVKDNMIKYKFKNIKYYHKAYVHLMDKAVSQRAYFKNAVMCCVPMSASRDRAYSQTRLLAEELAQRWQCKFVPDLLMRTRAVSQLSKMNLAERKFFIKDSLDLNPFYDIYGEEILVIDDIFTSGTTANECALVLKMYGAKKVYILCPCYD